MWSVEKTSRRPGTFRGALGGVAGAHLLRAQRTLLRDKEKSDEIRSIGDY